MVGTQPRCRATRYATLLCWVLAIGGAGATSFTDLFSASWTTECSGTFASTWAEVCGAGGSTASFSAPPGFTSAVVLADIARIGHSVVDETTELRIEVKQIAEPHVTTYVGLSSVRCPEKTACSAPLLHGVVSNLTSGSYMVSLQFKTGSGFAYFMGNLTTALTAAIGGPRNAGGGTAISRRISVQVAAEGEVVAQTWNSSGSGNSVTWADLPGTAMNVSKDLSVPGSVLVMASLPAVRTGIADINVEFRIVVNGVAVGHANSGGCSPGTACPAISIHGLAYNLGAGHRHWESSAARYYPLGDFNARVQYRVQSGSTVYFGHPWTLHPRQLTAFLPAEEEKTSVSWVGSEDYALEP